MTTGKTIALTRWTFVGEVMSLLFNMMRSEERRVGKEWNQWLTLFWGVPKSLQMVIAAMKLKDACSMGEKLWPTK